MLKNISLLKNGAIKLRDHISELLFPIECLSCGSEGQWLCQPCFRRLEFKPTQYCLSCKQESELGEFCEKCQPQYLLDGVWIAGDYENKIIASLIKNLKYRFTKDASEALGNYLNLFLRNLLNKHRLTRGDLLDDDNWRKIQELKKSPNIILEFRNNLIIPIPLHKRRKKWRGFNQAEAIAGVVAQGFKLEVNTKNLNRIVHKEPQAKLGESERIQNAKNCYAWSGENLSGRSVILIDDVVTTGSTLNECARILKKAGAGEIYGLVVAKG